MAGIYIHIPFCKQTCHYCNFHFSTSTKLKNGFLEALLNEISLRKSFLNDQLVETIYFGGGTPSLLSELELSNILDHLFNNFRISKSAEITFEANPDDINVDKATAWKRNGINRLSIGVQSFSQADLEWMNRAHTANQAEESILIAQDTGFSNLTIDLIFGAPTLSDRHWQQNVEKAIALQIPHLSCYSLTVEPKTPLESMINKRTKQGVDADDQARQFLLGMKWLSAAGYQQYEISNYARPGMESRHNSSYWQAKPYLGLGPSAHSYNGSSRQWNVANNALYIQSVLKNEIPFEEEILTPTQKLNEWVMTSLRKKEGLELDKAGTGLTSEFRDIIERKSHKFKEQGLAILQENALVLTDEGKLYADGIAAALFFEDSEVNDRVYAGGSSDISQVP